MNGKIQSDGTLFIQRGAKQKMQFCQFTQRDQQMNGALYREPCGDWCPLFGEPEPEYSPEIDPDEGTHEETGGVLLQLCHKTLVFDVLVDERCV